MKGACVVLVLVLVLVVSGLCLATGNVQDRVESLIQENAVMVFSKSYCPFCARAKRYLSGNEIAFGVLELNEDPSGAEIQQYLLQKTGQRTVPSIFINGAHIGGSSELLAMDAGSVKKRISSGTPSGEL